MSMNRVQKPRVLHTSQEDGTATYLVEGKRFVVTPVYDETRGESFASILLRWLQAEVIPQ